MSSKSRHRPLKERLLNDSDQVRAQRIEKKTLFSACHMTAFFKQACIHFAQTLKEPLNLVRASRLGNPVSGDLEGHLINFLKGLRSPTELMDFGAPMIASAFLLDNYPPNMHTFASAEVFQVLYQDVCSRVSRSGVLIHEDSPSMILPTGFVRMIADQLEKLVDGFVQGLDVTSAAIHMDTIKRFRRDWANVRSNLTCFVCISRKPEYGLPCGHSVCENCVRVFGTNSENDPYIFELCRCFLCGLAAPNVVVKLKPPTAGVRVLSIDGGGVRGVVPLQSLQLLQDRIGLPYPVQDNFDIAYGTSSGE
ncbi:hypothetical protein GP486_000173 [Trichoglossum hirsutum]|uniref:PNPLA domain-containing protein n=1 Tax=Trichoglossum hirsutum TaxID=265104 RepID=A0A9P8LIA1_9PEZI|nr:hypothetical protein GP486_000173 [Trichoglossum hirsutum]